jgi:hypothetical protein
LPPVTLANLAEVSQEREERPSFSREFDDEFLTAEGNRAFFGLNVLRGLIEGIDDFIEREPPVRKSHYESDPVLLGSAMWIDDAELIAKLEELWGACIVVTKQPRRDEHANQQLLRDLNERARGLPVQAFPDLANLAPKVEGKPLVVGPYSRMYEGAVPTIRVLGYRKRGKRYVPLMHAKVALLGHLWWTDDGYPTGEQIWFRPRRLWVSSANFTNSSRRSLEHGHWTEDAALVEGAKRFLLKAIALSEDLDAEADHLEPDLAPVEFDDEAFAEAVAEMDWDPQEDEEV